MAKNSGAQVMVATNNTAKKAVSCVVVSLPSETLVVKTVKEAFALLATRDRWFISCSGFTPEQAAVLTKLTLRNAQGQRMQLKFRFPEPEAAADEQVSDIHF